MSHCGVEMNVKRKARVHRIMQRAVSQPQKKSGQITQKELDFPPPKKAASLVVRLSKKSWISHHPKKAVSPTTVKTATHLVQGHCNTKVVAITMTLYYKVTASTRG